MDSGGSPSLEVIKVWTVCIGVGAGKYGLLKHEERKF
jgi:hypothetical protein